MAFFLLPPLGFVEFGLSFAPMLLVIHNSAYHFMIRSLHRQLDDAKEKLKELKHFSDREVPTWARSHLDPFPLGPVPTWTRSHLDPFPLGPVPTWTRSHLGPLPLGPAFAWARFRLG
jgi:hypothetical protein